MAIAVLLLLAGCAVTDNSRLVDNPRYEASGSGGWHIEIGDDITLRLGHNYFDLPVVSATYLFPLRPARDANAARRWRSTFVGSRILIETRPGPCRSQDGAAYPDHVRVRTRTLVLAGCGGPVARP